VNSRTYWRIASARKQTGFAKDDAAKQATRHQLIIEYKARFRRPPAAIFTLPGMVAADVKLFRAEWPDARIVGIDRQTSVARLTKAHTFVRQTALGPVENEIFQVSLKDYSQRRHLSMWRFYRNTDRSRRSRAERADSPKFDFPIYNLMFIDMTANPDSPDWEATIRMVDEHSAPHALIGVTVSLDAKTADSVTPAKTLAAQLKSQLRRTAQVVYTTNYETGSQMAFWILELR
jgi:hypothetical protein